MVVLEAAFFDLDKTVIAKASMVAFGRPFLREGLVSKRTMLRALYGQLVYMHLGASDEKLARVRESALKLTKGWDQKRVKEIVQDALEHVVEPIIYREAADLIEEHKAAGREVYLVSASPEEIVAPLAEYLGVDGAIASRAKIDDEGRYSGEMDQYSYGPFKADAMRELAAERGIDLAASYAYSDSYTDAPMLEVVGHPFAVNPDRVLLKLAKEREWEVLSFTHPVRLRDRLPTPPAGPTAAVGGALVAGAAGAVVWWRILAPRRRRLAAPPSTWARLAGAWPPRRRGRRR
jgi:HAD superfamily hydrolase (TIGR01490 family)